MKCKNEACENELTGRQKTYCSDKCRKIQTRTESRTNESRTKCDELKVSEFESTVEVVEFTGQDEPCLQPGYVCPIPEDKRKPYINYGPYMTANELAAAGLRFNRVSVPGDEDYAGAAERKAG